MTQPYTAFIPHNIAWYTPTNWPNETAAPTNPNTPRQLWRDNSVVWVLVLALLVLAVFALSALTKLGSEMSSASAYQTQARQNALLALGIALGELQRHAGDDSRITGMAGITGVAAGQNATTRYWCGVWRDDGSFVTWLTSGWLKIGMMIIIA